MYGGRSFEITLVGLSLGSACQMTSKIINSICYCDICMELT